MNGLRKKEFYRWINLLWWVNILWGTNLSWPCKVYVYLHDFYLLARKHIASILILDLNHVTSQALTRSGLTYPPVDFKWQTKSQCMQTPSPSSTSCARVGRVSSVLVAERELKMWMFVFIRPALSLHLTSFWLLASRSIPCQLCTRTLGKGQLTYLLPIPSAKHVLTRSNSQLLGDYTHVIHENRQDSRKSFCDYHRKSSYSKLRNTKTVEQLYFKSRETG